MKRLVLPFIYLLTLCMLSFAATSRGVSLHNTLIQTFDTEEQDYHEDEESCNCSNLAEVEIDGEILEVESLYSFIHAVPEVPNLIVKSEPIFVPIFLLIPDGHRNTILKPPRNA